MVSLLCVHDTLFGFHRYYKDTEAGLRKAIADVRALKRKFDKEFSDTSPVVLTDLPDIVRVKPGLYENCDVVKSIQDILEEIKEEDDEEEEDDEDQ